MRSKLQRFIVSTITSSKNIWRYFNPVPWGCILPHKHLNPQCIYIYIYMGHIYTYHIAIHSIHSWIPCFIGCYSNILYISESWWFDARDLDLSSGGDVGCWGSKKVVSLQEFPGKFHVPYFSIFFHHEIHCHSHQGQHKSGLFTAVVFFDVFLWRGRKPFRKVVWDYLNYPVAEDWHGFFSGGRGFTNS